MVNPFYSFVEYSEPISEFHTMIKLFNNRKLGSGKLNSMIKSTFYDENIIEF